MQIPDVNILLYAFFPSFPRHAEYRAWLRRALAGSELLAVPDAVLAGTIRIATLPGLWEPPALMSELLQFVEALRRSPAFRSLTGDENSWRTLRELCALDFVRGRVISDAYLASLAIANSAELITADQGFSRFPGLRFRDPLGA
jgi:uncharacterized protein